jgi:hypothetical protein
MVTDTTRNIIRKLTSNSKQHRHMLIDHIRYHVLCYSHITNHLDTTHKTDAIVVVIIPMAVVIIIIIIVNKVRSVRMALTHQTFISCHRKGNIVAKLCESMLITTRIQSEYVCLSERKIKSDDGDLGSSYTFH